MTIEISLVMAVYNGEKYIIEQLDSIRNQKKQIDEVIIIDDCSKDNSFILIKDYIKEYQLNYWKLTRNDSNLGYIENFRKGLTLANGEIVFLCDQDDIWSCDKVSKMVDVLSNESCIYSLASSFNFIDKDGKAFDIKVQNGKGNNNLINFPINSKLTEIDLKYLLRCNFSQGCTMAIKKVIIDEYLKHFDDKIPHDWALNLIAASKHGCYFFNEKLISYRIHNENTIGLDYLEDTFIEEKTKRTENRLDYLNAELEKTNFILQFNLSDKDLKMCLENKDYLSNRINMIKSKKMMSLLLLYIKRGYSKFGTFKTCLGDIISIVRKKDRYS